MTAEENAAGPIESLRELGQNAAILAVAAGFGQVFSVARELFVASQVGASPELDGLLVALVAPTMFAGLLASGAAAALAPTYAELQARDGRDAALAFVGAIVSWIGVLGLGLVILLVALAPLVVSIAGPGLDAEGRSTALGYVPVVAPILVLSAISGMVTVVLQLERRFWAVGVAWLAGPLASTIVTFALWGQLRLTAFAIALLLNAAITLGVLVVALVRSRLVPRPTLRISRGESTGFVRHATPLTASAFVLQFNLLADRAIGSLLSVGAVSLLRFGENVVKLPLNTIGPAWSQVVYPSLVRSSQSELGARMGEAAHRQMRYVIALFMPVSVATAALAPLIIRVAYERGAFDEADTQGTAGVLAGFAALIVLTMIQAILVGAHNSRRRGLLLMTMGFTNAVLNLIFNVVFGTLLGAAGIALSSSATLAIVLAVMGWRLDREEVGFDAAGLVSVLLRVALASGIVAAPVAAIAWLAPAQPLVASVGLLVLLTLAGAAGYVVVASHLGLAEPAHVIRNSWGTLARRVRPA
jgi:putative peptidoglycan lipid II flippase